MTRRRVVKPKSDITTSKKYRFNSRIKITLKVVITPLHLLFYVAFNVDDRICMENIHI